MHFCELAGHCILSRFCGTVKSIIPMQFGFLLILIVWCRLKEEIERIHRMWEKKFSVLQARLVLSEDFLRFNLFSFLIFTFFLIHLLYFPKILALIYIMFLFILSEVCSLRCVYMLCLHICSSKQSVFILNTYSQNLHKCNNFKIL